MLRRYLSVNRRYCPKSICLMCLAIIVVVGWNSGCEKDPASSYEPEVTNVKDNFHVTIKDVKNLDTVYVYYWPVEGSVGNTCSANIDQQASIQSGQASVVVKDNSSTRQTVYQTDLSQNGSFQTTLGTSGVWQITVSLVQFTGLIDFRAQRR